MACLNTAFRAGSVDFRNSARWQVQIWLLNVPAVPKGNCTVAMPVALHEFDMKLPYSSYLCNWLRLLSTTQKKGLKQPKKRNCLWKLLRCEALRAVHEGSHSSATLCFPPHLARFLRTSFGSSPVASPPACQTRPWEKKKKHFLLYPEWAYLPQTTFQMSIQRHCDTMHLIEIWPEIQGHT